MPAVPCTYLLCVLRFGCGCGSALVCALNRAKCSCSRQHTCRPVEGSAGAWSVARLSSLQSSLCCCVLACVTFGGALHQRTAVLPVPLTQHSLWCCLVCSQQVAAVCDVLRAALGCWTLRTCGACGCRSYCVCALRRRLPPCCLSTCWSDKQGQTGSLCSGCLLSAVVVGGHSF